MPTPLDADAALRALAADGPLPALREQLMLFGQFVGVWDMEIRFFDESGSEIFRGPGQWSFSWVLDGRAVQDVLTYAPLGAPGRMAVGERRIGTTLRYYDAALAAWRMLWLGATSGTYLNLIARADGSDILVEGVDTDGSLLRWSFTEITPQTFRWTGRTSRDQIAWHVEQLMLGRRSVPGSAAG